MQKKKYQYSLTIHMEGLRDEMTWWQGAAQRNTHEEGKTNNKEEKRKQSRKWLGVESRGYNGLLSLVFLLLCTWETSLMKMGREHLELYHVSHLRFSVKLSSWLNHPKSGAQRNIFLLWNQFRRARRKVTLNPVERTENDGFVEARFVSSSEVRGRPGLETSAQRQDSQHGESCSTPDRRECAFAFLSLGSHSIMEVFGGEDSGFLREG